MKQQKSIAICAGGTGGHLFPAQALARELEGRGWAIDLLTDERAGRFTADFPARKIHIIQSATIGGRNPVKILKGLWRLWSGYQASKKLIRQIEPDVAIGFGGYPTLPPIMAAASHATPVLLHEQNALMGRANRWLAKRAVGIVMGFAPGGEPDAKLQKKIHILGNPVRREVLEAAKIEYRQRKTTDPFHLLVFGGSQGARYFSEVMAKAVAMLSPQHLAVLRVVQQARSEDVDHLVTSFNNTGVHSEVSPFFSPLAERIANADLIMGRGGASTVSECAIIGRPSILVPLPGSLDGDQTQNAQGLQKAGGCKVIKQSKLTPERLAEEIGFAIEHPAKLTQMALFAKKTGKPNATRALADLVEKTCDGK